MGQVQAIVIHQHKDYTTSPLPSLLPPPQLVEYYQLNQGCLPVLLAHYLAAPAPEQAGEKEKAARPSSRPCSRSSSSSLAAAPLASQRSSSPTSVKMAASEAASEADSAMSQVRPQLQLLRTPSPCHPYLLCLHVHPLSHLVPLEMFVQPDLV